MLCAFLTVTNIVALPPAGGRGPPGTNKKATIADTEWGRVEVQKSSDREEAGPAASAETTGKVTAFG